MSAGKAEGANRCVTAASLSPFSDGSRCRRSRQRNFFASGVSALKTGLCACAREFGGGCLRLCIKARRRPAPARRGAAETVGSFACPRLARWRRRVRNLRRRRGRLCARWARGEARARASSTYGPRGGGFGLHSGNPGSPRWRSGLGPWLRGGRVAAGSAWGAVCGLPGPTPPFLSPRRPVGGRPRPKGFIHSVVHSFNLSRERPLWWGDNGGGALNPAVCHFLTGSMPTATPIMSCPFHRWGSGGTERLGHLN